MKHALLVVLAAAAAVGAMALADPGEVHAAPGDDYDYSQTEFPCQEDEVLGYSPKFGPDHVGCIHVEELLGK